MHPAESAPPVRFRTLGVIELVTSAGQPADAILAQPKRLALLAYLCVARPAGFRRRDQLLALFWPELDDARARSALSQALHRLRAALGGDVVVTRGPDDVGVDLSRIDCDAVALHRSLAARDAETALAVYQGDLLPGLAVADSPDFDQWLDGERAALRDRVVAVVWDASERARTEARLTDAARLARRAVELAPYDESGARRCIETLAEAGDLAGALRCYEEFAERVRRDLDLAPSAETETAVARLRMRRTAPAPRAAVVAHAGPAVAVAEPSPAVPATRRGVGKPWLWGAGLGSVAAVALLIGWALFGRSAGAGTGPDRVLVLPFAVRGDSTIEFLREGMVDLLSTSVEGLAGIQAVDPHAALAGSDPAGPGTATPDAGAAAARRLGANTFVMGEVIAIAGRLEVRAALYDSTGRQEAVLSARAPSLERLPEAVDDLARQLVTHRLPGPAERLSRLAAVTTDSLAALRAYLTGEQHLRRGEFGLAADAFREAVRVDSLFALAWFRLAVALEWVRSSSPERRAVIERAAALSGRLTERDRLLVLAYHAYGFGSIDEAEALYRQLVTHYPEDVEAWYGLADALFHAGPVRGRPIGQAEPAFRRLLALQPEHLEGRLHLARLLARRGDAESRPGLDSLVAVTLRLMAPAQAQTVRLHALRASALGDTAAARALEPDIASLPELDLAETGALVATMAGDLDGAAAILRALTAPWRPPHWRAIGHLALAHVALAQGRWAAARGALDAVGRLDATLALFVLARMSAEPWLPLTVAERDSVRRDLARWNPRRELSPAMLGAFPFFPAVAPAVRLHDLAALSALVGDSAAAREYADSLTGLEPLATPFPGDWDLGTTARAAVAFGAGRAQAALATVEASHRPPRVSAFARTYLVTHGLERWIRAESLRAEGRSREALDWYGSFTSYLALMDTPFEVPGWLRQAVIHEALGEREAARDAYARVLERWRSADPRFGPMLDEARAGFARVTAAR
jgi:DNA-binding SARP family transcriptional activator